MTRVAILSALMCAWFLALGTPTTARAAGFEVSPISLKLTARVTSTMLAVKNKGDGPIRLHVTAFAWDQKPNGDMVLTPTKDLVFFPAMVTLNARESRNLRVGATVQPGPIEKTYRVFIQELPTLVKSGDEPESTVGVLAKMGLPVFLEATSPKTKPVVTSLQFEGNKLTFALKNPGNVHYRPKTLIVKAKANDTVLHEQEVDAWYVLAGRYTKVVVSLPTQVCTAVQSVDVELKSDRGPASATLGNATCTP